MGYMSRMISIMRGYEDENEDEKIKTKDHTVIWVIGFLCLVVGIVTLTFSTLLGAFLLGAAFILFIRAMIRKEFDDQKSKN